MSAAGAHAFSVSVNAIVPGICGNGIIEPGEQCDGTNLNGLSCTSLGYASGTLGCTPLCTLDATQCVSGGSGSTGGSSGGSGGSSGGGSGGSNLSIPPLQTSVVLSGRAYPMTTIVVSEDSSIQISVTADVNAEFQATLQTTPGVHTFTLYAVDQSGRRSLQYTFTAMMNANIITAISGIFLAPTIDLDKSQVRQGDTLGILGQTAPASTVTVYVNSINEIVASTTAQSDGTYYVPFDTGVLDYGIHTVRSKSMSADNSLSGFSDTLSFKVGTQNVARELTGDLAHHGAVNIVDLSIMLYWWQTSSPQGLAVADLNHDGKVNLVDLSILLFNWTK